jgi:hypothetical protein
LDEVDLLLLGIGAWLVVRRRKNAYPLNICTQINRIKAVQLQQTTGSGGLLIHCDTLS